MNQAVSDIVSEFERYDVGSDANVARAWKASIQPIVNRASSENWDAARLNRALSLMLRLIEDIDTLIIHEKKQARLWVHQTQLDPFMLASKEAPFPKAEIASVASAYLINEDVQSDNFEWVLMDMLIFVEIQAFAFFIMAKSFGTKIVDWAFTMSDGSPLKFAILKFFQPLIGLAFSVITLGLITYFVYTISPIWSIVLFAALLLWEIIGRLIQFFRMKKVRKKSSELFQEMMKVYSHFESSVVSPMNLKKDLDRARDFGVVFDPQLHVLVDRMSARNSLSFIASERL